MSARLRSRCGDAQPQTPADLARPAVFSPPSLRAARRKGEAAPAGGAAPTPDVAAHESARRALLCTACGHEVTHTEAAFSVAGSHAHTFMNPSGFVFEIACYREAPGATPAGSPSSEWSWFPAHAWRIALCRACRAHLGWTFQAEGPLFYGLIRDRLTESDAPGEPT